MSLLDFFTFWHPKIALRYLPIVEEINLTYKDGNSILEVGSGAIGAAPYINRQVIGVDKSFDGKNHSKLKQVVADAVKLPFADCSFDYVVSSDVLEHIRPDLRQKAVFEWLRVAKKELILAFPEGEEAEIHDKELYDEFKKNNCQDCAEIFFKEHLEYGLPRIEEVTGWLKNFQTTCHPEELSDEGSSLDIQIVDNLNLSLRKFLMHGWMTKNPFVDLFFRKILLLFIPIMCLFNQSPTYRKIVFIKMTDKKL